MRLLFPVLFLVVFSCPCSGQADSALIYDHLKTLTRTQAPRCEDNTEQLNETAAFITSVFKKYSDSISEQPYTVNGQIYKNVICSFGTENKKRIIVGAHYDVCGHQPGADDNASGVTGLLELSRLLKGKKLNFRIDLVAYSLEEPPYFNTSAMGSYVHAKSLSDQGISVFGMISLEMIGYFKDERRTQHYPFAPMSLIYGNKGNYITLVKRWGAGNFARKFGKEYKDQKVIRSKKFSAPFGLLGVAFSDDLNYWKFGFSSLMLTDTSFHRNMNYHETTDTMETLDIPRMAKVIDGVLGTLLNL